MHPRALAFATLASLCACGPNPGGTTDTGTATTDDNTAATTDTPTTDASDTSIALTDPNGYQLQFQVHGIGVQIYTCTDLGHEGLAWVFTAPEATLYDDAMNQVGTHYAGPTWEGTVGDKTTGVLVSEQLSKQPNTIPWRHYAVADRIGDGPFAYNEDIQEINTDGGAAPADGCDMAKLGQTIEVPYSADYLFWTILV